MIIDEIPFILFKCLLITVLIELIVAIILGVRDKIDILNIILVNILTNPLLNIIYLIVIIYCGYIQGQIVLYCLEILVLIVEGLIYRKYLKFKKINPFAISIILNVLSYIIGMIID